MDRHERFFDKATAIAYFLDHEERGGIQWAYQLGLPSLTFPFILLGFEKFNEFLFFFLF